LHGGTLEIHSEKGRGTTVTVRLSAGRVDAASIAATLPRAKPAPLNQTRRWIAQRGSGQRASRAR